MRNLNVFINALLVFIVLSFLTACVHTHDLRPKLDSYVNAFVEQDKFSGSVFVAQNGKTLLSKGYGMANYEHDIPNTPDTKFRLASITKQFTALAIMQLQEMGLLSLDDTVSKYIHKYPKGDKITIHNLLTHTSGIPNVQSLEDYKRKKIKPHTLEQLIDRFKDKPLDFHPGDRYQYSNSGYMLLGYIIEKISGKNYETFLKENIFAPLSMKDSGYDKAGTVLKNRASGYRLVENKLINSDYIDMSFPAASGALYSTANDLHKWDQALYSEKLISKESLAKMFNSHMSSSFPGYGYGWIIRRSKERYIVEHAGGIDGFSTDILRYPEEKLCVIVLSNFAFGQAWKISNGLAAIVLGERYEWPEKKVAITVDPTIYDQYVGRYKLDEGFIITISQEDNRLFAQAGEQVKIELSPSSLTDFFHRDFILEISFIKDADGKIKSLVLHDMGDHKAQRIED